MTPRLTICGLGPGGRGDLTEGARQAIEAADIRFVRTGRHPTVDALGDHSTFDALYDRADQLADVYESIADALVGAVVEAPDSNVVYAVPGSPLVLERSVARLRSDDRLEVDLVPSLSFLDVAWARLGVDPVEAGVRLVDGHVFGTSAAGERGPLLVAHAHASWVLSDIKLAIDAGPEQTVIVLQGLGTDDEKIMELPWPELDRSFEPDHLTSLYLPEVTAPVALELQRSVELMHRLRQDCPWDAEQTHASLRPYLLEEAYEVLEAIDGVVDRADDPDDDGSSHRHLEEELGDLWFQILFHSELAAEAGQFTVADVARNVHDKLVARHPHVFGETVVDGAGAVVANWEAIKKKEKGRSSIMEGIPAALPALSYAEKVLRKGGRSGAGADPAAVAAMIDAGIAADAGESEIGDLLLAVVDAARAAGVDAEGALRRVATEAKHRFMAAESGDGLDSSWVFG